MRARVVAHLLPRGFAHLASAPRRGVVFATLMTAIAGFLDAVGYIQLQHLYVSFMSGNSTHFGMSLARADWSDVALAGVIISAFVAGALAGTLVAEASDGLVVIAVLGCELALLLLAVAIAHGGHDHPALVLVALAMGMQNALHQMVAGADVGKGFITGALFALGQSLAQWLHRRAPLAQAASNLLSWLAFIGGAVLGTLTLDGIGLVDALAVICLAYALMIAAIGADLL